MRELIKCNPGTFAEATTSFAADDPIFAGHFPDNPLVPGVILTEALAPSGQELELEPAQLGAEAGLIGAGLIAFEALP